MPFLDAFFAANSKREMQTRDLWSSKSMLNPYYYFNTVTCFDNNVLLFKLVLLYLLKQPEYFL